MKGEKKFKPDEDYKDHINPAPAWETTFFRSAFAISQ